MTTQLDAPQLERLVQIKKNILALLLEAVSWVRGGAACQSLVCDRLYGVG